MGINNLPCLINGHRPEESEEGYPIAYPNQLTTMILPCNQCGALIKPSKDFTGSYRSIAWDLT